MSSSPLTECKFNLLIDGDRVAGASRLEVIDPSTARAFASCARADARQMESAIAAAKRAFRAWSVTPLEVRSASLLAAATRLQAQRSRFAELLTREQGKPSVHAMAEVDDAVQIIRAFADMELPIRVMRDDERERIVQIRAPLGVVAAITPWNYPLGLLMIKIAPALLAGNTVVAKPAPTTPLTSLAFGELCMEVFPAGVFNVVADGNDLGDLLTGHADVAMVAFTGSTVTGRRVMARVADSIKRLTLELGGNDAAIVLDDVDIEATATSLFRGAMVNSGQVCLAIKRAYVPDALYEPMCSALARLAREAVVGDGLDPATEYGPLQNRAQFDKVLRFLEIAHRDGNVIAGGQALSRDGYFVPPTIVRDIGDDSPLVQEEQFGPILPVLRYRAIDEAITRANSGAYGLGGSIWGRDLERAYEVARRIDAGTVWINKHLELPHDIPFGGAKQSGFGVEMGQEGLEAFTQARIVNQAKR